MLTTALSAGVDAVVRVLPIEESNQTAPLIVNAVVSFIIFALLFAAMFKWLPDVEIAWKDVILGAIVTAVLFMIGKFLIGLYIGRIAPGAYGAAGSLVLILVWVYYSGLILFFGAELTEALGTPARDRDPALAGSRPGRSGKAARARRTAAAGARGDVGLIDAKVGAHVTISQEPFFPFAVSCPSAECGGRRAISGGFEPAWSRSCTQACRRTVSRGRTGTSRTAIQHGEKSDGSPRNADRLVE